MSTAFLRMISVLSWWCDQQFCYVSSIDCDGGLLIEANCQVIYGEGGLAWYIFVSFEEAIQRCLHLW